MKLSYLLLPNALIVHYNILCVETKRIKEKKRKILKI